MDVGAGHGLLAHVMLLVDDSASDALIVDTDFPPSALKIHDALVHEWPRLNGRLRFVRGGPGAVTPSSADIVVSCHSCGAFTDEVIDYASSAGSRLAVLPCCHDVDTCDTGGLTGWLDPAMAIDVVRVGRLRARGYRVRTQTIPSEITPKNRLILAEKRP